ncbi:MAG: ROK family protein [Angelakisella sp.]
MQDSKNELLEASAQKNIVSNQSSVRRRNQRALINIIRDVGNISRIELAKQTGAIPASISIMVNELLAEGLISETGSGESRGGRRPVLLEICPTAKYGLALDLRIGYIECVLFNFRGEFIFRERVEGHGAFLIDNIIRAVDYVMGLQIVPADKIFGIGIVVSGIIDEQNRKILLSSEFKVADFDIHEALEARYRIKVVVDRSTNAALRHIIEKRPLPRERDVILITFSKGIGMAAYLNGALYQPEHGSGGEIGHTVVERNGKKCHCGNYGCLATVASPAAAVARAETFLCEGKMTSLREVLEARGQVRFSDIVEACKNGDMFATQIFIELGDHIGLAVANMLNLFNPSALILAGLFDELEPFRTATIRTIQQRTVLPFFERLRIESCPYNSDVRLSGITAYMLQRYAVV